MTYMPTQYAYDASSSVFYIKIHSKCEIESLELVNQCLLGSQSDRKRK